MTYNCKEKAKVSRMKLTNTYTNQLEEFVPLVPGEVSIYVCGPTVYNYIHIGNARPPVLFDTLRRYFEAKGNKVRFVSNFTDVDDKIINSARATNETESAISTRFIEAYLADLASLNCKTDYIQPKVTDYIDSIIGYIESLIKGGYAYLVNGDVYFRVNSIAEYGRLSNRKLDDLLQGARVEVNPDKENPLDFTLWKRTEAGLNWDSPFSRGRPGWHTECVAMIDHLFGGMIDIHGGGADLVFPHHENEIAQSLACHNHPVAKYWLHNGRLQFEGEKMSKSLGNVVLVKDFPGNRMALRLFLLSTHYRAPINYTEQSIEMYREEWDRLEKTMNALYRAIDLRGGFAVSRAITDPEISARLLAFDEAMEADINTANAITELQALLKFANVEIRRKGNLARLQELAEGLGYMLEILGLKFSPNRLRADDIALIHQWEQLRKEKNYEAADRLRQELIRRGLA